MKKVKPITIVDVGAGSGFWGKIAREEFPKCYSIAIEIWKDYITNHKLKNIYDKIINDDIKNVIDMVSGDLIIFGDVLEHMEKEIAMSIVEIAVKNFKYIIINSPDGFQPQDAVNGNIYEVHRCGLEPKDFEKYNIIEMHKFPDSGIKKLYFNLLIRGEKN